MSRIYSKEQKEKIWAKENGNKSTSTDPFGRPVNKNNYEPDHIIPYSKGGKTTLKNAQVLSPKSNSEKSDKLRGIINGKSFNVDKTTNKMTVKSSKK